MSESGRSSGGRGRGRGRSGRDQGRGEGNRGRGESKEGENLITPERRPPSEFTFFDKVCKASDVSVLIKDSRSARTFLEHALKRPLDLLHEFLRDNGSNALKAALCNLDYSRPDAAVVETLLDTLSKPEYAKGLHQASTHHIYCIMLKTSGFLQAIERSYKNKKLFTVSSTMKALAHFIAVVIKHNLEKLESDSQLVNFAKGLLEDPLIDPASKEMLENSLYRKQDLPDERNRAVRQPSRLERRLGINEEELCKSFDKPFHDNDDPFDFQKISFFPTANEIMSDCTMKIIHRGWMGNSKALDTKHIDRQFRLLREDMIAPLRDEVKDLRNPKNAKRLFQDPVIGGVDFGRNNSYGVATFSVFVSPPQTMHDQLKKMSLKQLVDHFEDMGKRILERESVLLFFNLSPYSNAVTLKHIGVIINRDAQKMADAYVKYKILVIGVKFQGPSVAEALRYFTGQTISNDGMLPFCQFVSQARTQFFAYEPIVNCLKELDVVPLRDILVLENKTAQFISSPPQIPSDIRSLFRSDKSQLEALEMAIRQKVSIIQGPPGTGKTFLGVQIVKTLLQTDVSKDAFWENEEDDFSGDEEEAPLRILCICYTNHALDSFLESLIESGIPKDQIIRLGSQTKISDRMKECSLTEQTPPFQGSQGRLLYALREGLSATQEEISGGIDSLKRHEKEFNRRSWEVIENYLENNGSFDILDCFTVPQEESGFARIRGGKRLHKDAYWVDWCDGKGRPADIPVSSDSDDIWDLSVEMRVALRKKWYDEFIEQKHLASLLVNFENYEDNRIKLDSLKAEQKLVALRRAKLIACTTTYAAKFRKLLDSCRPTVVLVEEAAEIHESHILCNLSPDTKQLIMIGDHLQLRPKLSHYPLRTESGQGINFDMSLFERLVKRDYPVSTLAIQHRMRPEISQFVRNMTYPSLIDHDKVRGRDNIHGLAMNIAFIDHRQKERKDSSADPSSAALGLDSRSKVNTFEIQMALSMVKYLLQQGYKQDDIVILTPYLGQLMEFRREMRNSHSKWDLQAEVGFEDKQSLIESGIGDGDEVDGTDDETANSTLSSSTPNASSAASSSRASLQMTTSANSKGEVRSKRPTVRIATIDNYQGEEAKIIIASLVRSNGDGDVGFVGGPERINVLFSRARDGFYILGNSDTYLNAKSVKTKELWSRLLNLLSQNNMIVEGFPVVCRNHKVKQFLKTPDDFIRLSPDGGCYQACNSELTTCRLKHRCKRKCHPFDELSGEPHTSMKCFEIIIDKCVRDHQVSRMCCQPIATDCRENVTSLCDAGKHPLNHMCYQRKPAKCMMCDEIAKRRAKLEQESQRKLDELAKQIETLQLESEEKKLQSEMEEKVKALERKKKMLLHEADLIAKKKDMIPELDENDLKTEVNNSQPKQPVDVSNSKRNQRKLLKKSNENKSSKPGNVDNVSTNTSSTTPNQTDEKEIETNLSDTEDESSDAAEVADEKLPTVRASKTLNSNETKEKELDKKYIISLLKSGKWQRFILHLLDFHPSLSLNNPSDYEDTSSVGLDTVICFLFCHAKSVTFQGDDAILERKIREAYEGLHISYWNQQSNTLKPAQLKFLSKEETLEIFLLLGTTVLASQDQLESTHKCLYEMYQNLKESMKEKKEKMLLGSSLQPVPYRGKGVQHLNIAPVTAKADEEINTRWEKIKKIWRSKCDKEILKSKTTPSEAMELLLKMTGLKKVKECFLQRYNKVDIAKQQSLELEDFNFNTRFDGNPGTGKTTVAELFCQFLIEIELLPQTAGILKKTGAELSNDGLSGLEKSLNELKACGGGVVFVDEAYQLVAERDGKRVLDFILGHSEKMKGEFGKLVWIFAGYKRQMDELFEHNPGLPSRFKDTFHFEDYTNDELENIFRGLMTRGGEGISANKDLLNRAAEAKKKKEEEEKEKAKKRTSLPVPQNPYASMYGNKPDQQDQWGNTWHWDQNRATWYDDFGNISGTGVQNLGTNGNPIVSIDRKMWVYDVRKGKLSFGNILDPAERCDSYPGKPNPPSVPNAAGNVSAKPAKKRIPFTVTDDKWIRVAMTRMGRLRNSPGFGNARAVRNLFDTAHNRLVDRISKADEDLDIFKFVRDDLLGPKATAEALKLCPAWDELQQLEGLSSVKASIEQLIDVIMTNAEREEQEKPVLDIALNRIFLGNPGTGKTTVAKIYARMLSHLGLLSKGDVILKNSSDFVGSYLGQSENQTRGILEESKGCVLVIDEAYGLYQEMGNGNEPYREAVINTLVEQIQGVPGEDRAVILLGYRKEMETMLTKCNPGLSRRFQLENAFQFEDYDDDALTRILQKKIRSDGLKVSQEDAIFAIKQLAKARAQKHFGNAGAVNNLLSEAKIRFAKRIKQMKDKGRLVDSDLLLQQDFVPPDWTDEVLNPDELLSSFVGCDTIRDKLMSLKAVYEYYQEEGKDPKEHMNFNYLFTGSPGTGKTSVARLMGKMFHSLGLIPSDEVVETSPSKMQTGYVGQAAQRTRELFTAACGKVLFIDEAYGLNPNVGGSFMREAVDEIVQMLTDVEFKGKMIVILAGYEQDINTMLQVNTGLQSRFTEKIHFDNLTLPTVTELLWKQLTHAPNVLDDPIDRDSLEGFGKALMALPNFANGRDVDTFISYVKEERAKRYMQEKVDMKREGKKPGNRNLIVRNDLNLSIQKFMNNRMPPSPLRPTLPTIAAAPSAAPPVAAAAAPSSFSAASRAASSTVSAAAVSEDDDSASEKDEEDEENEEDEEVENDVLDEDMIDWGEDMKFLKALQTALERIQLNDDIDKLSNLSPQSKRRLIAQLVRDTGYSTEKVEALFEEWQANHHKVKEILERQKEEEDAAKESNRKALVPIWRCAVCGRADQPFIVCTVAPYVVRYDEIDI